MDDSTARGNVLVLGSKGFIGGSLVRHLSGCGEFVVHGLDLPELPASIFTRIKEGLSQTVRCYQEELSEHYGTGV